MNIIDAFLNRITMYRLILYYLTVLIVVACICGSLGLVAYSALAILFSALIITATCWLVNEALAYVFDAYPNVESPYITAFILVLIMTPVLPSNVSGILVLIAASVIAMVSKYVIAIQKRHIFNPAALAVVITGFAMGAYASWWVGGNLYLLPFVLVGGLLITRKIQRFDLVLSFMFAALVSTSLTSPNATWWLPAWQTLQHSPLFFFAFVMLTEPATTPPITRLRIAYGTLTGLIFAPAVHLGSIFSTPELALVASNVFSYAVSPKQRLILTLERIEKTSATTADFVFAPDQKLHFKPGQYMEWTLPHTKSDSRGNRRYFTIASSPTESDVRLGVKFYDDSSSFKRALARMAPGDQLSASQLAGDFVLPADAKRKVAFIAGGIGITPFRSMVRYMMDTESTRDAVLVYANRSADDIAYREIFQKAERTIGLKTIYAADNATSADIGIHHGRVDMALIKSEIPDYAERTFYLSGPRSMVLAFQSQLSELGIPRHHIKIDFFPGLV